MRAVYLVFALTTALLWSGGALAQGALLLVGGGSEPAGSLAWFVGQAPHNGVIVLDYANAPGGLPGRLTSAGAEVTYLPVTSEAEANDPAVAAAVLAAGGIFLPGGDQWRYVQRWRGTLLETALRDAFAAGAAVGGTSAGAMALSEVVFDARYGSITSRNGLLAPAHQNVSLTDDFLGLLPDALIDTHFYERGRLGRLVGMLARYHADAGRWVTGVGLDDGTALAVDPDGSARVMGGGAVALLYPTPETTATVAPNEPLAVRHLRLVQVVAGHRVDLASGAILEEPEDAADFTAVPFAPPAAPLLLDGSLPSASWTAPEGSLPAFLGPLAPTATVCVVSVPGAEAAGAVLAALAGRPSLAVEVDAQSQHSADLATAVGACDAFVWAGNNPFFSGSWTAPTTPVGAAIHARVGAGAPSLFPGRDAPLASPVAVTGTDGRCDGSFLGLLGAVPGTGLLPGVTVIPNGFGTPSCSWENTTAGLAWGVAQGEAAYGLLLPEGGRVRVEGTTATVSTWLPAVLLDARGAARRAFPLLRHNAALDDARLHVLRDGETFALDAPFTDAAPEPGGARPLALSDPYPNPARDGVAVALRLDAPGVVRIAVYDLLGRAVWQGPAEAHAAGEHVLRVPLAGLAPGVYVLRAEAGGAVETRRFTLLR